MAVSVKKTILMTAAFLIFAVALVPDGPPAYAGEWSDAIKNKLNPVRTTRDDKGAWFVTGEETAPLRDVFEAVGYAVAVDRLWQAELYRRTGRGAMAEIFGPDFLAADMLTRTINRSDEEIETAFQNLKQEEKDVIEGYVAGFNRRIEDLEADPSLLPFEFKALGFSPAPWTCLDIMAWSANLLRYFDPEATNQHQIENMTLYLSLAEAFPADFRDMFEDLRWTNDPEALTVIRSATEKSASSVRAGTLGGSSKSLAAEIDPSMLPDLKKAAQRIVDTRKQIEENLKKANAFVKMGSYAWTVAGTKTASGNPIIYSGPQMGFSVPAICQEGSIQAGGLHISGMAVPGLPGLLIGRTPHHAWSMQVANAHTTDFYIEFPSDVYFHRYETIRVAGAEDVVLPVYRSSHGPIVNPMPYDESEVGIFNPPIAWKYSHWEVESAVVRAILGLARAQSMDEFGAALEFVPVSMHFCYADIDGNIAYWMSGRDPVRPAGEWRLPQGFFSLQGVPQLEWDANVLKPRSTERNTPLGFYGGWNNKNAPDIESGFNAANMQFGVFHRAHVVDEYLSSHDNLTFGELRDLALNIATTDSFGLRGGNPWQFASPYFTSAVAEAGENSERQAALDLLSAWDGHFVDGGESEWVAGENLADAWVLMDAWIREVLSLAFEDELGDLYESESALVLFNVLLHGLAGENSGIVNRYDWFSNLSDPAAPQTAPDTIVAALDATLSNLGERPWRVGQRDEIILEHDLLGEVHSLPYSSRSTFAHIVEFAPEGPVRVESMFLLGESGTILMDDMGAPVFDDNFFSMAPIYDTFAHRAFPVPK